MNAINRASQITQLIFSAYSGTGKLPTTKEAPRIVAQANAVFDAIDAITKAPTATDEPEREPADVNDKNSPVGKSKRRNKSDRKRDRKTVEAMFDGIK